MKSKAQILREEKGLTQSELASRSGLSLRTVQRVEAGNIPKGFTLKSLAAALQTEPRELTGGKNGNLDIDRAKIINAAALSFLLFPFGNIVVPAILTYRTNNEGARALGRSITGLQIIWTAALCLAMILAPFLQDRLSPRIPWFVVFLAVLSSINVIIIVANGIGLNRRRELAIKLGKNIL